MSFDFLIIVSQLFNAVLLFFFCILGGFLGFEKMLLLPAQFLVTVPNLGLKLHPFFVGFFQVTLPLLSSLLELAIVSLQRIGLLLKTAAFFSSLLDNLFQFISLLFTLSDLLLKLVRLLV